MKLGRALQAECKFAEPVTDGLSPGFLLLFCIDIHPDDCDLRALKRLAFGCEDVPLIKE